jgi:hypothetical protein
LTINGYTVTSSSFGSPANSNLVTATTAVGSGVSYGWIAGDVSTVTSAGLFTELSLQLLSNILYPNGTQPNLLTSFVYVPQPGDIVYNDIFTVQNRPNGASEDVNFTFSSISLTEVSAVPEP